MSGGGVLYLSLVVIAALATGLTLMPVAVHRRLFRHHRKLAVVRTADFVGKLVLGALALLIAGGLSLVFSMVISPPADWICLSIFAAFLALILLVMPLSFRRRKPKTLEHDR